MKRTQIITDSCSDLTPELLAEFDIDYVKMSTVLNGEESPAILTWSAAEAHSLYQTIREGARITTAQVSLEEFAKVFKSHLEKGLDIVYIACSSKQSGSVNTGAICSKELLEEYPGRKIHCIDSLNASMGEGMLAVEAAKLANKGKSADEIRDHVISVRKKINQFVTVHTLEHLKKAGRVSASNAFFGNLIGVKPIIISDTNGVQTGYKKAKGRQASFREIVSLLKEAMSESLDRTVYIAHADCPPDEIISLKKSIEEEIKPEKIIVGYIGPIIGASIGPDAVGIWGFGKEVTYTAQ